MCCKKIDRFLGNVSVWKVFLYKHEIFCIWRLAFLPPDLRGQSSIRYLRRVGYPLLPGALPMVVWAEPEYLSRGIVQYIRLRRLCRTNLTVASFAGDVRDLRGLLQLPSERSEQDAAEKAVTFFDRGGALCPG